MPSTRLPVLICCRMHCAMRPPILVPLSLSCRCLRASCAPFHRDAARWFRMAHTWRVFHSYSHSGAEGPCVGPVHRASCRLRPVSTRLRPVDYFFVYSVHSSTPSLSLDETAHHDKSSWFAALEGCCCDAAPWQGGSLSQLVIPRRLDQVLSWGLPARTWSFSFSTAARL